MNLNLIVPNKIQIRTQIKKFSLSETYQIFWMQQAPHLQAILFQTEPTHPHPTLAFLAKE